MGNGVRGFEIMFLFCFDGVGGLGKENMVEWIVIGC